MDEQHARFLLQSGPPRAGDRNDPAFIEAMAQAGADPLLGDWVGQQQHLTEALSAKLDEIKVPAHLKDHILAGGFVSRRAGRHRRRWWLAAAAAFIIALGIAGWQRGGLFETQPAGYAALRADMCEFFAGSFQLEVQSTSLERLRAHLRTQHQIVDYSVPDALAQQRGVGCRLIAWRGQRAALICFTSQGQLVHLLIVPRSGLPTNALPGDDNRKQVGEWATAGWADEQNVYLAATRGSAEMLAGLL